MSLLASLSSLAPLVLPLAGFAFLFSLSLLVLWSLAGGCLQKRARHHQKGRFTIAFFHPFWSGGDTGGRALAMDAPRAPCLVDRLTCLRVCGCGGLAWSALQQ